MMFGLSEKDISAINGVFSKFSEVRLVIIYGSRAKGNFRPASDIDLVIVNHGNLRNVLGSIDAQLDDLLLPYKIDLTQITMITNADLIDHIRRVGKVFYSSEEEFILNEPASVYLSQAKQELKESPPK